MAFDEKDGTKPIGTFTVPSDGKLINCTEGFEVRKKNLNLNVSRIY